jgi:hypothetical protein
MAGRQNLCLVGIRMIKARSKYRNVPTVVDGVRFASKAEAKRDGELQLLVKAGAIRDLRRQPRFPLWVRDEKICTYVGDWSYWEVEPPLPNGRRMAHHVVEDRKGVLTPAFKIKWALAKALHPEIEWRLS